jgi:hypothetical protein
MSRQTFRLMSQRTCQYRRLRECPNGWRLALFVALMGFGHGLRQKRAQAAACFPGFFGFQAFFNRRRPAPGSVCGNPGAEFKVFFMGEPVDFGPFLGNGCRKEEMLGLEWRRVDLVNRLIYFGKGRKGVRRKRRKRGQIYLPYTAHK